MRRLRAGYRWGPARIGHPVGLSASTVHRVLTGAGLGRLDQGDRAAPQEEVMLHQRERPGELVHIDIKNWPASPTGVAGGHTKEAELHIGNLAGFWFGVMAAAIVYSFWAI